MSVKSSSVKSSMSITGRDVLGGARLAGCVSSPAADQSTRRDAPPPETGDGPSPGLEAGPVRSILSRRGRVVGWPKAQRV